MRLMRWSQVSVLFGCLLCPVVALTQVLSVTPSITVGERYDDNIFQDSDNEEDDFITVISPGIELRYAPSRDTEFDFSYRPAFEIFADNSSENQVSHALRLGGETQLSRRFSLSVSDQLVITEDPSDRDRVNRRGGDSSSDTDPDPTNNEGDRDTSSEGREQTIRNLAEAALRFQLAPRSTIALLYSNLIEDVEAANEADEIRNSVGLEAGYVTNISRGNRVFLSYIATFYNFSANAGGDDEDDFQTHTASIGYEHHLSPTLTGIVQLGYAFNLDRDEDAGGDDTGVVGRIGLEKLLRTGSASLEYSRSFTSGGGSGGQVIADRILGQLRTNITPKIAASLGANLSFLDFQSTEDDDEDRIFFSIRPGLTYQVLRALQLFTTYSFSRVLYDTSSRADRTDHRFAAGARLVIRTALSIGLTYEYRTRSFENMSGSITEDRSGDEFDRNIVFLSVTYGPTFRF